jgi:hypothetical protein
MAAKNTLLILLLIATILSFSCDKPTETPLLETKISGRVLDKESNAVIAGAQITTNPTTSSVTTDASGTYTISDVKAGEYVVSASKSGYKTNTISVVVTEGKTASADVQIETLKPELTLSTQTIDFGSNQTTASLIITNGSGINSINWTAAKSVNWLTLSQTSGTVSTASNTITLSVDRTGLSFGNYSTIVTITSNGGNKDVSVTMTVANPNAPQLTVSPIVLDLGSSLSQATFSIRNSGTGKLNWTANTTTGWISLTPQNDSTTTEIDEVKATINRSGLSPGNYNGDISVLSNAGSQNVNVKMNVPAVPSLSLSTNNLDFDSTKTQLSFNISNAGTGTLNWTASGNQSWMTVQPQSGNNAGTVNVTINKAGLSPGNYSGAVTVSSNGGSGNVAIAMRVPFPAPPTPVTATVGTVSTNSIQISWTQYGGPDFAAYKVYYATSPAVNENSTLAATITTKTTTTYTVTGLSSNTTYYFRIFILDQSQQTSGSNTVAGKTEKAFPSWQQVALPVNFQVQSTHYISESNIWIAGYTTISNYNFPRVYQFNGSAWIQITVQSQDSVGTLLAIAFRNNAEGWAASANRIYKYDGSNWKVEYYLTSANLVEAIGTANDVWFYGSKTYRWNGSQLTDQNLSPGYTIKDMHFYNSSTGFANDDNNIAYMFNGVGWISLGEFSTSFFNSFPTVSGTSKNDVWGSDETYLYHYDGVNWRRQNDIGGSGIKYYFGQIRMTSPTEGWATTTGSFSPYYFYYYNGTSWTQVGTVSGKIEEIKDFENGNLWGIIYSSPNKLMRLQ